MKKLEGIITVTGVLLIIGMPLFLLFAGTDTSKINADTERLISINSYSEDKSVVKSIDINDYEEDFDVLDGSKAREEIEIIESQTPLAAPIVIDFPEETEPVTSETVIIEPAENIIKEKTEHYKEKLISVLDAITEDDEDVIWDDAVPEWLDVNGIEVSEEVIVENTGIAMFTTENVEDSDLIIFEDSQVPEGLDENDHQILPETLIEEDEDETYEPESEILGIDSAASEGEDDEIVFIHSEVLVPEGLEDANIISFECSELNDGYGTRLADVTFINDDGCIIHSNFAY